MHPRWISRLALLLSLIAGLPATVPAHPSRTPFTQAELTVAVQAMEEKGHPSAYLNKVFMEAGLRKLDAVVGFNVMNKESTRDYSDFLAPYALRKARRFRSRYRTLLGRAEQAHGVAGEIIVALLQVETQFGRARQPFRVLEVYTTLLLETGPDAVERHYLRLKPDYPELEREYLGQRLEAKQKFALEQLSALVEMGLNHQMDIARLRGSYAGAFGIPQFLPSSYLRWAADGNSDNVISLNNFPDAIFSIAAYLSAHGWAKNAEEGVKRKAVWEYNHSPEYVDAVFAISQAITPKGN